MNIVFSTTRQWNPGDEFILRGVINLLKTVGVTFKPIIWNRHPSIRPGNTLLDNSFDTMRHDLSAVDYVVIAGTPEWHGHRVNDLRTAIREHGLRCAYIGIGYHGRPDPFDADLCAFLQQHVDIVTCRDRPTWEVFSEAMPDGRAHLMPCPSVFHAQTIRPPRRLERVGVNYQTIYTAFQSVSEEMRDGLVALIKSLSEQISVTIICNYIDECIEASQIFGSARVRYSYDSADYEKFFAEVDCVVGARVHGCLGALGVGTPAMLLGTETDSRRAGIAEQIPVLMKGNVLQTKELTRSILSLDAENETARILKWRTELQGRYISLLSELPLTRGLVRNLASSPSQIHEILRSNQDKACQAHNVLPGSAWNVAQSCRTVMNYLGRKFGRHTCS